MYKLYKEEFTKDGQKRSLYGTYESEKSANCAIIASYIGQNLGYYWRSYILPEGDELAGATYIDYGSHTTFFILKKED